MSRAGALLSSLVLLATCGVFLLSQAVAAQTSQEGQLRPDDAAPYRLISMDCLGVKFTLGEIHRTDRLLRVTLGEGYENVSSNLMRNLNTRIVQEKLDGSELIRVAAEFEEAHGQFRKSYSNYDDAMLDLLKANCQSRTQSYYLELQEVKTLRQTLHDDVQALDALMQEYHEAFKQLKVDIETGDEEVQE